MFRSDMCERDIVNAVRNMFRAHVPESNAWAEPNHFSVASKVFGGLAFSALQEARNGIDQRVMIDTAEGEYLDQIAARPPYNTTRLPATHAEGCVDVDFADVDELLIGDILTREDGVKYEVTSDVNLEGGKALVKVKAVDTGPDSNSVYGQPFADSRGNASTCKDGIMGGFDVECDDDLRDRLYAYQPGCPAGSIPWIENCARSARGIKDAFVCEALGGINVYVTSRNGLFPSDTELAAVQAVFDDPCKKLIGLCVRVKALKSAPITVQVRDICPPGISRADIEGVIRDWFLGLSIGQSVVARDIELALQSRFPSVLWQVLNGPWRATSTTAFAFEGVVFV